MNQDEPDSRFFTNYYTPGATPNFEIKSINAPSRIYRYMNEKDLDFKVDLETSLPLFGTKTKAKYGAAFSNKQRAGQQYKFSVAGISSSFYDGEFSLDGNLGNYIPSNLISTDNPTGIYYSFDLKDSKIGSYTASSNLVAGYAMLDIPVSEKFRVVAGARVEYYMVSVSNNIPKNFSEWKGNDETEMNVLPSLNLTYSLTENTNLRLAASQTVSRPVFREIAPQSFYDYRDAIRYTGNPNLKSCNISNLDLRFEHYFERGEMFALSGFYKYFNAPIERRLDPGSQNPEIVYFNSTASNLFGIEAEFRKGLGFMKLKDFSIGANCTFVHSSIALNAQESLDQQRSTRPMNGQAPYVINTYLSFDNEASKINANLSFNISGEKMWLINSRSTPYVYEMPRAMLNFNIGKGIGEHWSVDFSVDNILNAQSRNAYLGNNNTDATFLGYYSGRSYQIGFKYAIK
jgi:TonB-dependent receptor